MNYNDIMLDLETLDNKPTSLVVSIGAVVFDPHSKDSGERFYVELTQDMGSQERRGRTISASTFAWWMGQGESARELFAKNPRDGVDRMATEEGLKAFAEFVSRNGGKDAKIWGNGADFDNVVLGGLYDAFEIPRPWSYSKNRCFRTMKNLDGVPAAPSREGLVHHNALDDAIYQAIYLQEIFACRTTR